MVEKIDFNSWMVSAKFSEGSGRSEKLWLESGNKIGLFKFPKTHNDGQITYEHVSEKLASDIAKAIGMKSEPVNIFGQAIGRGAVVAGGVGSFAASMKASKEADITNLGKAGANSLPNRGKHLLAGIVGGISGMGAGMAAADAAKDHKAKAAMEAMQKRNAMDIARGKNGSTFFGRIGTMGERMLSGEDTYEKLSADARVAKAQSTTAKDLFSYLEGKGKTDGAGYKVNTSFTAADSSGNDHDYNLSGISYDEFQRAWQSTKAAYEKGSSTERTFRISNEEFDIYDAATQKALDEISYSAGTEWAERQERKPYKDRDDGYKQKREDYETVGGIFLGPSPEFDGKVVDVSRLKKAQKKAQGRADHIERSKQ